MGNPWGHDDFTLDVAAFDAKDESVFILKLVMLPQVLHLRLEDWTVDEVAEEMVRAPQHWSDDLFEAVFEGIFRHMTYMRAGAGIALIQVVRSTGPYREDYQFVGELVHKRDLNDKRYFRNRRTANGCEIEGILPIDRSNQPVILEDECWGT